MWDWFEDKGSIYGIGHHFNLPELGWRSSDDRCTDCSHGTHSLAGGQLLNF